MMKDESILLHMHHTTITSLSLIIHPMRVRHVSNPISYHIYMVKNLPWRLNHQPLKWFMESDKLIYKFVRWALLLKEHDVEIVHRVGTSNLDANGVSRNPSPSEED